MAVPNVFTSGTAIVAEEVNEDFTDLETRMALAELFAQNTATTTGLTFGYKAGRVRNGATVTAVSASTIALTASNTNYIEVNSAGTVSKNTTGFSIDKKPLFVAVCDGSGITSVTDKRGDFEFESYFASGVGVGASTVNAAAALQIDSTTKGLLLPRMTTTERNAISSPPAGLLIYNTTSGKLNVRGAAAWEEVTSS